MRNQIPVNFSTFATDSHSASSVEVADCVEYHVAFFKAVHPANNAGTIIPVEDAVLKGIKDSVLAEKIPLTEVIRST